MHVLLLKPSQINSFFKVNVKDKKRDIISLVSSFIGFIYFFVILTAWCAFLEDFYQQEPQYTVTTTEEIDPVTGAK